MPSQGRKAAEQVRTWLTQLGLERHARAFVENGYDDVDWIIEDATEVTGINSARLETIGLSKPVEIESFLDQLQALRVVASAPSPKPKPRKTQQVKPSQVGTANSPSADFSVKSPTKAEPVIRRKPKLELTEELEQIALEAFYSEEEARELAIGTRVICADNRGQWASARIEVVEPDSISVRWIQWNKLTHTIQFEELEKEFLLSKCDTPSLANAAASKIKKELMDEYRKKRAEAAEKLQQEHAEKLHRMEQERHQMAQALIERQSSLKQMVASDLPGLAKPVPVVHADDEQNEALVDQMCEEFFYNEAEAKSIPLGTTLCVADNKGQWSEAVVLAHSETELCIRWTGPWAKIKHRVPYDNNFKISKAKTPTLANDAAKRVRAQMRNRPGHVAVIPPAVGCKVSCKSPRRTATGTYQLNGKILCDCHRLDMAISDFAYDCAEHRAKRPYECIDVHTDNGIFSLHELRDLVTGNTHVNIQRQVMRNKRLLDQIRADGGDQVLSSMTHKDLNEARAKAHGNPVEEKPQKRTRVTKLPPPTVAAAKPKPAAKRTGPTKWVQCEHAHCCKWRQISVPELKALTGKPFYCDQNSDARFASCKIKQEFSNKEIDQMLGLDESSEEGDSPVAAELDSLERRAHELINTQVLVPFKGFESKRLGVVGDWLKNKEKFDVCFKKADGTQQWYLMSFAEVQGHRVMIH